MRLFRILTIVLFAVNLALAQAPANTPSSAASRDDLLKLIDLLRVRDQMKDVMVQLRDQVHTGALENLRARTPHPTAEQVAAINKTVDEQLDDMQRKYSLDHMLDDIIPVYQRHLSKADVDALLTFYSSPTGQKMLDAMPAMMDETMQVASTRMQPIVEAALDNVEKKIREVTVAGDSSDPARPVTKKKPAANKPAATSDKPAPKQ